jgi:hypothetical protein
MGPCDYNHDQTNRRQFFCMEISYLPADWLAFSLMKGLKHLWYSHVFDYRLVLTEYLTKAAKYVTFRWVIRNANFLLFFVPCTRLHLSACFTWSSERISIKFGICVYTLSVDPWRALRLRMKETASRYRE